MIPAQAVEAACGQLNEAGVYVSPKYMRVALEAAAPHIRAQALEDAAEAWQVRMDTIGRGSVEAKTFMQMRAMAERPTP